MKNLTVRLPFPFGWVGKLDGDCEKISFKAGEGLVFRYERNFLLRQQTISLGVGKDIDKYETKMLNIEAGIDFEATALFI